VLLSVADWAANERITPQAANKRIREHGIPRRKGKIDPDEASRIFEATKDARQQERSTNQGDGSRRPGRPEIQTALDAVKLKREQIRLRQLEGSLVDAEKIASEIEARFRSDAEALLNWPARVAAEMAAELGVDERLTHAALDKHVRQFMSERSMVSLPAGVR